MTNHPQPIVQELWNYWTVLRDDGLSYGDYVEQLTYLLFPKMAHEHTQPPWRRASTIPKGYHWPSLMAQDRDELEGPTCALVEVLLHDALHIARRKWESEGELPFW